jgi:hypothetical protein
MSAKDDDFAVVLLLLSSQFSLLASIVSLAKLKQLLPLSEIHRRDCRIPRCALLHPDNSPFRRLYLSCNEQSLITLTGLDYRSFGYLLEKFSPLYFRYSPSSSNGKIVVLQNVGALGGRPRLLDPAGCLALILGYTRTRGSMSMLQMVFGLTNSANF